MLSCLLEYHPPLFVTNICLRLYVRLIVFTGLVATVFSVKHKCNAALEFGKKLGVLESNIILFQQSSCWKLAYEALKCCLRRQLTRFWKGTFVFIHVGFGGWTQIRSGFYWHAETSVFHCHPVSLFSGKRSGILQKWILTESVVNWISQKTSCVSGFQFYSWPQRGTLGMKLDTFPQRTTTSIR